MSCLVIPLSAIFGCGEIQRTSVTNDNLKGETAVSKQITPQQDPTTPEGVVERLLIKHNPRYGKRIQMNKPEALKQAIGEYSLYHLVWEGTEMIPFVLANSKDQIGKYAIYFFKLDQPQRVLVYHGRMLVDLNQLNGNKLPVKLEPTPGNLTPNTEQQALFLLKQPDSEGVLVDVGEASESMEKPFSEVTLHNLNADEETKHFRMAFWFETRK